MSKEVTINVPIRLIKEMEQLLISGRNPRVEWIEDIDTMKNEADSLRFMAIVDSKIIVTNILKNNYDILEIKD